MSASGASSVVCTRWQPNDYNGCNSICLCLVSHENGSHSHHLLLLLLAECSFYANDVLICPEGTRAHTKQSKPNNKVSWEIKKYEEKKNGVRHGCCYAIHTHTTVELEVPESKAATTSTKWSVEILPVPRYSALYTEKSLTEIRDDDDEWSVQEQWHCY